MADPHWTSYLGVVGSITGIAGAIMGYASLRRSYQIKALDLRIELKRSDANATIGLKSLRELMGKANTSRQKVASAMGLFSSGMMDKWKAELEFDLSAVDQLSDELLEKCRNYDDLSPKELEAELIKTHTIKIKIQALLDKYNGELAKDSENVKQIREDKRRSLDRR